jgi:glycosyltransferase involved in cell wall biosynthesis
VRVCIVYDCLYPWTVGGAERWMRNLAEALARDGHDVTYLTRRQWPAGEEPRVDGVRVLAVSREEPLYGPDGNRTIGEPLRFGRGVLRHLLRHGRRYDVVHTASFPYFSLLAAALARPLGRYALVVDWHEVWSAAYWRDYLGGARGRAGRAVQRLCARVPQRAFSFSRLHAARLEAEGLRGEVTVLEGEYAESLERPEVTPAEPVVVFAGRMIPEKRAPAAARAMVRAADRVPGLRGELYGAGPEHGRVLEAIGGDERMRAPGFVAHEELERRLRSALCLLAPSSREGYGLVVVEASARGVPAIVVAGEDNAATELVQDGVNGFVAASADPEELAEQVVRVWEAGPAMRERTADWFAANAQRLSMGASIERVLDAYRAGATTRR